MRYLRVAGNVALWVVTVLAAVGFVAIGIGKFVGPSWARKFAGWGYPDGFYMVIGVLEVLGGVMLLVPRLASYAALLLVVIMVAAAATLLLHGDIEHVRAPLLWLVVMAGIGLARRRHAYRPHPPLPKAVEQL
jgi:uncharacterized membrane protein YphA (DoxX/SURF4 family)